MKEQDALNHILGKYIAFSFNDPQKYPSEPFTSGIKDESIEQENNENLVHETMTDDEMEIMAKKIVFMFGGDVT